MLMAKNPKFEKFCQVLENEKDIHWIISRRIFKQNPSEKGIRYLKHGLIKTCPERVYVYV